MKLTGIFLALFLCFSLSAQLKKEYETRPVIISYEDSVVNTGIITEKVSLKILPDLWYYWYFADQININKGGYHGNLLHGRYTVFDTKKKMITSGTYNEGLKSGIWKSWYPDGNLKSIDNWENGKLENKSIYYNQDGSVYQSIEFLHGQRNGECIHFESDSLIIESYKKGVLLEQNEANSKIPKIISIKKGK